MLRLYMSESKSESERDFAWKSVFTLQQFVCEAILHLFHLHVLNKGLNNIHVVLF